MIMSRHLRLATRLPSSKRWLATAANPVIPQATPLRPQKEEGTIASAFASLGGEEFIPLPDRFTELKKSLWNDSMIESWRQVLGELEIAVAEIKKKGSDIIPRVKYTDLARGLPNEVIADIRQTGTVVIDGAIPIEEALAWKQSILDYAAANRDKVKGFPPEDIQVYEFYNSRAQTSARTHPNIINSQRFLLSLWHASSSTSKISLSTPISYFDRLRIRHPGDQTFALGPHIDGGSVERWEDAEYRRCFEQVLKGGDAWRQLDSFDASPRLDANSDLYHAGSQCSVFRAFQGWTSLSSTGPNEGTLRVFPRFQLATAYVILRPFFRPRRSLSSPSPSLAFQDWEPCLDESSFPGSVMGRGQELNEITHPHLCLDETMVSVPKVQPGDQVYWHCDVIHAVESVHKGKGDSSVFYIPATPLTLKNAEYLRDQRANFVAGLPAPDFPGGIGESQNVGRATVEDVTTVEGRRLYGLEPFTTLEGDDSGVLQEANKTLFG